jgi:hypothetical protein
VQVDVKASVKVVDQNAEDLKIDSIEFLAIIIV